MIETVFFYFIFALLCAALFNYIHFSIGAPSLNFRGSAEAENGMIGSALGRWLCDKYNLREAALRMPAKGGAELTEADLDILKNFYSSDHIDQLISDKDFDKLAEYYRTLSAEKYIGQGGYNWYKALGICPPCSIFWFAQLHIIPALFWANLGWAMSILAWLFFAPLAALFRVWIAKD